MPKLIAHHARPIAGGVDTIMAVSDVELPSLKEVVVVHLETPLAFAGAASLLGSKRPLIWALIGLGVSLYTKR